MLEGRLLLEVSPLAMRAHTWPSMPPPALAGWTADNDVDVFLDGAPGRHRRPGGVQLLRAEKTGVTLVHMSLA